MSDPRKRENEILQNTISCLLIIKMRNKWKIYSKTKISKQIGYSLNGGCLIDVLFAFAVRISDVKRNFILIEFMKADTLFGIIALLKLLIKRNEAAPVRAHLLTSSLHLAIFPFIFLLLLLHSSQLIIITI